MNSKLRRQVGQAARAGMMYLLQGRQLSLFEFACPSLMLYRRLFYDHFPMELETVIWMTWMTKD